ncbi:MAG: radical SAM protein [Coleofasciculaceae cyanobacterium]
MSICNPILSGITLEANIEFTSNCNLRCTYCAVSQPEYKGYVLPEDLVPTLVDSLISRGVETVTLNGHGETTMLDNWVELCQPFINKVQNIQIISNFSKLFQEHELELLANFANIYISIETNNPKLLREVRRRTDLGIVLQNINNIRAKCKSLEIDYPKFIFSSGIYDKNVFHLVDFAYWAAALQIDAIQFWNFIKYPDIEYAQNVYPLTSLTKAEKILALQAIDECMSVLEKNQIGYVFAGNFLEIFRKDLNSAHDNNKFVHNSRLTRTIKATTGIVEQYKPGMTRDCYDPWFYTQIRANGEVLPCCVHSPIARYSESRDFNSILNGSEVMELRNQIFHGNLDSECSMCENKPLIPVTEFQKEFNKKLKIKHSAKFRFKEQFLQKLSSVFMEAKNLIKKILIICKLR